jgi:hypothetical protein
LSKKQIALFFCCAAKAIVGEPVSVELMMNGPAKGTRLQGCVGWTGNGWHVMMNANMDDNTLWRDLWHECGHIALHHAKRVIDVSGDIDRAIVAGRGGELGAARLASYVTHVDREREIAATAWGDEVARQFQPALEDYLRRIAELEV